MRGKPYAGATLATSIRITPAHAGKTVSVILKPFHVRDHPRACGENKTTIYINHAFMGSPPRMRGKLYYSITVTELFRITPAHAGKTQAAAVQVALSKDHPRACGENSG